MSSCISLPEVILFRGGLVSVGDLIHIATGTVLLGLPFNACVDIGDKLGSFDSVRAPNMGFPI